MPTLTKLKFWKSNPNAVSPRFATTGAACFDLHACITQDPPEITIHTLDRVLIPTGIILDIPEGYSVRLHPRSGLSWNNGITLANCEGVVDFDYVKEVKIIIINLGDGDFTIKHGDRICQAEMVKNLEYNITETETQPLQKTDRTGGFGSTGI